MAFTLQLIHIHWPWLYLLWIHAIGVQLCFSTSHIPGWMRWKSFFSLHWKQSVRSQHRMGGGSPFVHQLFLSTNPFFSIRSIKTSSKSHLQFWFIILYCGRADMPPVKSRFFLTWIHTKWYFWMIINRSESVGIDKKTLFPSNTQEDHYNTK